MPSNLIAPDGSTVAVEEHELPRFLDLGYRPETAQDEAVRARESSLESAYGDRVGTAAALGVARGLTVGLSDVALRGLGADTEMLREVAERSPIASGGGELLGAVAPALLTAGSSAGAQGGLRGVLAATPAGLMARAERAISATGATGSLGTKIATAAAGGAVEGGVQNVGVYLSDVALENKELSAEGFIGAMGKGALLGGAIGGGLAGVERGLVSARKLFPRHEITPQTVEAAEQAFSTTLRSTFDEDQALRVAARRRLDEIRVQRAEVDLETREAIAKAKLDQEASRTKAAKLRTEAQRIRTERTAEGPQRGPQPQAREGAPVGEAPASSATAVTPSGGDDLLTQLQRTQEQLDSGQRFGDLSEANAATAPRKGRGPKPTKLPDGFNTGVLPPETVIKAGIPEVADAVDEDAIYVVSASDLADRKPASLDAGRDPNRAQNIRKAWGDGKKVEPINVTIWQDGRMELAQGRHRLDAALEDGRDLAVRFSRGIETADAVDDVVAKIDPEAGRVVQAARKLEIARIDVNDWLSKNRGKGPRVRAFATGTDEAVSPLAARSRDRVVTYEGMEPGKELVPIDFSEFQRLKEVPDDQLPGGVVRQRAAAKAREYERDISAIVDRAMPAAAPASAGRLVDDARDAVAVLGKYEQARAELADALGDAAPGRARETSVALQTKADGQSEAMADAVAQRADETAATVQRTQPVTADIDPARATGAVSLPAAPVASTGVLGAIGGKAADAAALVEALQFAGLPLPDVDRIPVIGPLLGMWLKYRAGKGILSRFGGKVPATAETHVAARAAQLREKAAKTLDQALGLAEKGARQGKAVAVASTVAALESPLWSSGEQQNRRKAKAVEPTKRGVQELFQARAAEVMRAANDPDSARQEISRRLDFANPAVRQAVEEAALRKIQFLAEKMPRDPRPAVLFGQRPWEPDTLQIERWARFVRAADDPSSVLEDLADDRVTPEAAEALRAVYPSLYGELQRRMVERAPEMQEELTYQRRVQLGILFQVPTDPSLTPEALNYLQAGTVANESPAAAPAQQQSPPVPSVASVPRIADSYETGAQRRASR